MVSVPHSRQVRLNCLSQGTGLLHRYKHTAREMTALGTGKSADSELQQLGAGHTITFSALTITGKLESEPTGRFSPPALTHQECAAYRPPLQPRR